MNRFMAFFLSLLLLGVIGFVVWHDFAYTCTKWSPYYTQYITSHYEDTTTITPYETRDCERWIPNK